MPERNSEPDSGQAPRRPRLLIYVLVAAVAAGLGVVAVTLTQHVDPAPASTRLDQARVERELTPGLVDLRANLQYSHEMSVNTGIIVSADGLVLTSNNDITGATGVKATLVGSGRTYTAPTNTVYVADQSSNSVSVINGGTDAVTATVGVASNVIAVAVDPSTGAIFAADQQANAVSAFTSTCL